MPATRAGYFERKHDRSRRVFVTDSTTRFPYDLIVATTFSDHVSDARLTKFRRATSDAADVEALYAMDMRLSAAGFKALHMCEVVVRNAMNTALCAWNTSKVGDPNWTLNAAPMLRGCFKDNGADIDEAKVKAQRALGRNVTVTHDDILSNLTFGAWRYLMPPGNPHAAKDRLWDEALEGAFANKHQGVTTASLVSSLSIAYDLRNRVAHHEPIFHLDLGAKRRNIRDLIDAVSRDAKTWFVANDTFGKEITDFQRFAKLHALDLAAAREKR